MGAMIERIWIGKTIDVFRAMSSSGRLGTNPLMTIPAAASEKRR
jgi:hypothetical protein